MYEAVLGREGFRKGMDLYFQRHDGQVGNTEEKQKNSDAHTQHQRLLWLCRATAALPVSAPAAAVFISSLPQMRALTAAARNSAPVCPARPSPATTSWRPWRTPTARTCPTWPSALCCAVPAVHAVLWLLHGAAPVAPLLLPATPRLHRAPPAPRP